MSTLAQAQAIGRRRIAALERDLVQQILDQYGVAWRYIDQQLTEVEGRIAAAIARGETVNPAWLRRQEWWTSTLDSIDYQLQRYTDAMAQHISTGQMQAVQASRQVDGLMSDYLMRQAAKRGVTIEAGIRGQVNTGAFERWVVAQQPDSPIRKVIDRYGERVSESIRTHMTEGLAAGDHPRTSARRITADVGDQAVEGRIRTLTRQETMRAYRGALRDGMEALGLDVVTGWRWLATLSRRSCPACLAMHGQEFPFDQYPDRFHVGCRCAIQPIANPALVPRRSPGQTGEEWLRNQPVAIQRNILQTRDRYDAFRQGTPLVDFVQVKHDDTWGDSIALRPSRESKAA